MACAAGLMGKTGSSWIQLKNNEGMMMKKREARKNGVTVSCSYSSSVMDPYKTLRVHRAASESEVKKAFRRLALQYHPDVCRGSNCIVQFHEINEAYDLVMSNLRGESNGLQMYESEEQGIDEPMRGMDDPDWDLWEEWMGWEGAGIRDYSSHINPYI
ncbi:chaperone protein dnaJ 8, chloroplastic-like isoform X1 [Rhodamnia argentea]|uniref:Chaperone protein dnaJ 8, chloroplastic-like isoform X1 n=1 Tax=Rhodamnia argentea TaxID=178133 RepID=A0A8B8QI15_9MYRT|nr:chaperone protein dnaJ 8, chloroplastic-like isoform X1 [Rhodamnia argentea]